MTRCLTIERGGPLLLETIAALHAGCFEETWNRTLLARLLAMPGAFALLGMAAGRDPIGEAVPVGFVMGRAAAGECEILSLGVLPDYRRGGVGRALVGALLAEAAAGGVSQVFLEVSVENAAARALYRILGFSETGRRPGYYRLPCGRVVDALVMRRDLDG